MFESLTAFIPDLEKGDYGSWSEQTGDGTPENPYVFCHVEYSEPVRKLIDALFAFGKAHEEMELFHYPEIMDEIESRLQKSGKTVPEIYVSDLDARLVIGFLLTQISLCRFDEGAFLSLCKAGTVLRCLQRLKEIDETGTDVAGTGSVKKQDKRIVVGDFVKVRDTDRVGEVIYRRGKSLLVEFLESGSDELVEERFAESRLERIDIPELDAEQVRAVVRGELDIMTLCQGIDCMLVMRPDAVYMVSAEDLLAGIRKLKPDLQAAKYWMDQLLYWTDDSCEGNIWPEDDEKDGRLLCESSVVLCARNLLDEAICAWDDEDVEGFGKKLSEAEQLLEVWQKVGADILRCEEYPDAMLRWLTVEDDDDSINKRNSRRQDTFKKCLDALCLRGDVDAYAKRGYCFYCGTDVYSQNWEAAEKSFLYVYEHTGEAWPANTLGYIYYYGRCNGGVPEYEKAFHWFSIGHAGGVDESTYKLGDLYVNGFGIKKNEAIAADLYWKVYQDTLDGFLSGSRRTKFADAAIRMGNCCRDGICCWPDPEKAYGYYLQARMALKMRMADCSYFGDESVLSRLTETMDNMREVYTDHAKVMKAANPFWLEWLLDREHRACRMTWKALKDGKISLTCTRAPDTDNEEDFILATFPAGDYCELLRKITVQTEKDAVLTVKGDAAEVVFDDFDYIWWDDRVELKRTGETVAEIKTDGYRFKPVVTAEPEIEEKPEEPDKTDKFTWGKGDLEIVKRVYKGQTVEFFPTEKRPLTVPPVHERLLKDYRTIYEFQEDYKTKEEREAFVAKLMNYEIDELIELCDSIQGKTYYEQQKKPEKVFEFRKHAALHCIGDGAQYIAVYDGPGSEKYVEYGNDLKKIRTIRIGRKEIRAIQEAIEDNLLFETDQLEDPYKVVILDGTAYEFFFALKGRENETYGSNIEQCRDDFDHCLHSAHAIRTLEEIRDILSSAGIPNKYFEL